MGGTAAEGPEQASSRRGERVLGSWEEREEALQRLVEAHRPSVGEMEVSPTQGEWEVAFQPPAVEVLASQLA